jgi:tetratricopeptide (TPR) repeat protein
MKTKMKFMHAAIAAVFAISSFSVNAQQLKVPAPSPFQTLKQAFALSDITIEYSRPSVKGRVIYGDVVPFGKTWRTGANQTTKITFGEDVKVEGNAVAAGTYGIYSVPNKDSWDIMLYKDLTLAGDVANYKAENEVVRFKVKPNALSSKVETLTFNVADVTPSSANVELLWEQTRVAFAVVADIDAKIMKNIEANVLKDGRPYFQAASYYYETNKDLKQALTWADKAIEQNPKAYWVVMLKAKIQAKSKDNKSAIATAEQVIALAKEDKNDDYVKMAEKLIAEAKKG